MSAGFDFFILEEQNDMFSSSTENSEFHGGSNINVHAQSIAPIYSNTSTYNVGDYVMYNGQLYVCNTEITTPEAWNPSHWAPVDVMNAVESEIPEIDDTLSIAGDAADAKAVGDALADSRRVAVSILTRDLFPVCKKNISVNTGANLRTADVIYNYFRSDAHDNLTGTTYRTLMLMSGRVGKSTTVSNFVMYRSDFKPISSSASGVKVYVRIDRYRIDGEGTVTTPPRIYFASYDVNGAIWWKYITFSASGYAVTDYALDDVILTNGNLGIFVQFHRPTHGMEGRLEVFISNTPDLPVATADMSLADSGFIVQDDPA